MSALINFKKTATKLVIKIKSNFTSYTILDEECQDIPKIPIKTYKWEDVKRSRRRGEYPWTHLTKPPFDGELDPEAFTMEAFRKSRSSSPFGKSETQEISEIEDEHELSEDKEKLSQINDELPYDNKENIHHINQENFEIPKSSSVAPDTTKQLSTTETNVTDPMSRSKSEEPKSKRKLSLESHGKINFPKLGLKSKFINAKNKIKVPKLAKRTKSDVSENKNKKQKVAKSEKTSTRGVMPQPPNKSPVYIHIPLKPPPGETDEFSKYEFESPGPSSRSGSLSQLQRIGSGRKMSLLGLLTELKKVHDEMHQQKLASESRSSEAQSKSETPTKCKAEEKQPKIELAESFKETKPEFKKMKINLNRGDGGGVQRKESDRLIIEEITNDDKNSTKSDTESLQKSKLEDPIVDEPEENLNEDNISQYLDKEDECKPENSVPKDSPAKTTVEQENVRKLESTLSKWKMQVPSSSGIYPSKPLETTALKLPNISDVQRPRARSEEPKRKRKGSIESSYSRKSLSRLGFMKRIKEATDKIKLPKLPSFSKTNKPVKEKEAKKEPELKIKKKLDVKKSEEPVYIHIPLKLPPGQTDEFSHFAEEIDKKIDKVVEEEEVKTDEELEKKEDEKETSTEVRKRGVQLIILTPPSDDEILDGVPETPSESDQKCFDSIKIDELKNLARKAVDQVCPDTIQLETVKEDEVSDEHSGPESSQENLEKTIEKHSEEITVIEKPPVLIDEEDGLKLSDAAIAMINEELAKELKAQEMEREKEQMQEKELELKPSLKKKVSFKRKSRAEDGERIYEDVQISDAAKTSDGVQVNKSKPLESFQSMSVDEEKSYLDKKVMKDTSLEDDYNKWSTSNDHEYEPVNPPPEDMIITNSINNHLISTHQQVQELENTTNKSPFVQIPTDDKLITDDEDIDMQEVQNQIEERFFSTVPETKPLKAGDKFRPDTQINPPIFKHPLNREDHKTTVTTTTSSSATPPAKEESIGKTINNTIRTQTNKIKTKLQNIKRPKFPSTKLKKPHFSKPNFKMPKLPEKPSITLPSFMTRKESLKDSWRNRQLSTESNAGDSTKKVFDFKTYPRIFDKHKKSSSVQKDNELAAPPAPEFATVPRVNRSKGPVGSRWMDKFKDIKYADEETRKSTEMKTEPDVIRIPLHPDDEDPIEVPSHTRYNEDIDIEDDFDRQDCGVPNEPSINEDYLQRWNHGEFHDLQYDREMNNESFAVTDLDNGIQKADSQLKDDSFDIPHHHKEEHSSGSLSEHRHGVLEEIDSDEFFLREKGISQENIEVGKYLSSEIREAFRNPINALSQLQSEDREYDLDISDQSEPIQDVPRRKPLRKPKRKKTPHVSSEKVNYDQESITTEPEEYPKPDYRTFPPPDRPRRRSKRTKKKKTTTDDVIPYQETIPIEQQFETETIAEPSQILENNILRDDELLYRNAIQQLYENEHMKGIDQPEIKISDPYYRYENFHQDLDKLLDESEPPIAPTRKNRSLKSLNASEHSSIIDELVEKEIPQQDVEAFLAQQEYIIPTPEPPPSRPKRTRSRTHSQSGGEDDRTSRGADSLVSDTPAEVPCVEEPCVKDIRDSMGYAVVEKLKAREPPLPPSRFPPSTPPRTRKAKKQLNKTDKFATTPRSVNTNPPVRPLRNYSTLGGSGRTSRSKSPTISNRDEKENIHLGQYIELEDDRNLQSGEIIQKMKDRPLPPPPRPPRRAKAPTREVFRDISHERNIPPNENNEKIELEEIDISTQSINEDFTDEQLDPVLADLEDQILTFEETITHAALVVQPLKKDGFLSHSQFNNVNESLPIEKTILINIETNEHNDEEISVIPDEFRELKDSPTSEQSILNENEKVSEITNEFTKVKDPLSQKTLSELPIAYDEEISEIPEEFTKLKDPPSKQSVMAGDDNACVQENQQVGILNAQKMQVMDLDVDKLRVNELQASKIIVSELDGMTLQVSEINSKAGNLVVSGIELPPHIIQEMLQKLQSTTYQDKDEKMESHTISIENKSEEGKEPTEDISQKKTPFEDLPVDDVLDEPPPVPPRCDSKTNLLDENENDFGKSILQTENIELNRNDTQINETIEQIEESEMAKEQLEPPPVRPPRKSSQVDKIIEYVDELPAVEMVSKIIENVEEEAPIAEFVSKVIKNLEDSPVAELVSNSQTELAESSQTVEETKESSPRELPVLPIEPPESSSEISSKSEEPPPRPPEPVVQQSSDYVPSQPPASFYALRSPQYEDFANADIPLPPRRKHHRKAAPISRSSSEEVTQASRRQHRSSQEPSIPQLSGQLVCACAKEIDRSINILISYMRDNVLPNVTCRQDLHIMFLILLILIAGLILLSGDERITIHHHHWEFFNPPKEL